MIYNNELAYSRVYTYKLEYVCVYFASKGEKPAYINGQIQGYM